jgi:hypothetical protein
MTANGENIQNMSTSHFRIPERAHKYFEGRRWLYTLSVVSLKLGLSVRKGKAALALISVAIFAFASPSAIAQASEDLDALAKEIIARQLQLAHDINLLQRENMHPEKRARRIFIYNFGNSVATDGGLIGATGLFWSHAHNVNSTFLAPIVSNHRHIFLIGKKGRPNQISPGAVEAELNPQIVGQAFGAGFGIEVFATALNAAKEHHARKLRDKQVAELKIQLDDLLAHRQTLSEGISPSKAHVFDLQQRFFRAESEALISIYQRSQAESASHAAYQLVSSSTSFSRNMIGGIGNIINLYATNAHKRAINADGNLLSVIAASQIVLSPLVSNGAALMVKRDSNYPIKHPIVNIVQINSLAGQLTGESFGAMNKTQLQLYKTLEDIAARQAGFCNEQEQRNRNLVSHEFARSEDLGSTKLTEETMGLIVSARKPRGATNDNRVNAWGNTVYTSGQSVNLAALVKRRLDEEIRLNRLKKQGKDPASFVKANEEHTLAAKLLLQAI